MAAFTRRGVDRKSALRRANTVSDTEEAKATRRVREKIILPIEAGTVVDDIDPEFVGGLGDVDLRRIDLSVRGNVPQQLADHLKDQHACTEVQDVLVQPDRQSNMQSVAAAYVDRQPLQRRSQADVIESRWADILDEPPVVFLDFSQGRAQAVEQLTQTRGGPGR